MEAFNLLKFWRNAGADVSSDVDYVSKSNYGRNQTPETDEETDDDDSFFELEFTAPDKEKNSNGEEGFKFIESPKDVFRNGKVFPMDSNVSKPQSPISVLRSAPKFRAFMLGFKKSKPEKTERNGELTATPKVGQSKRFSVEEVPAVSLLTRDNSLRSKLMRESFDDFSSDASSKRYDKDVPKYLKLIKPLYTRASKRYGEKMSSPLSSPATERLSSPRKVSLSSPRTLPEEKRPAGLKNVYKNLGRSRSELSVVGMTPSPVNRRDDSLLQQHDIQSAILHCKRSFNSSAKEFSTLSRCISDPSNEELKRCSI